MRKVNCPQCGSPAARVGLIDGYKFYCSRCGWNHEIVQGELSSAVKEGLLLQEPSAPKESKLALCILKGCQLTGKVRSSTDPGRQRYPIVPTATCRAWSPGRCDTAVR